MTGGRRRGKSKTEGDAPDWRAVGGIGGGNGATDASGRDESHPSSQADDLVRSGRDGKETRQRRGRSLSGGKWSRIWKTLSEF